MLGGSALNCRLDMLQFDIAAAAGWYSAIAGLLAGFALLAILLPLDHEAVQEEDRSIADSIVVFTCAFFALLVLSFNYAGLSGRPSEGAAAGIAAHEQFLFGAVFGLASLLLLFGLRAVIKSYGANAVVFAAARDSMQVVTALLGPILALSLQFSNALDLERVRLEQSASSTASCGPGGIPSGVWINLSISVISILAVLILAVFRRRLHQNVGAPALVAKGVLVVGVAVTVWTSFAVPLLPGSYIAGAVFEHVALLAFGVATVVVSAAAWSAR